MQINTGKLLGKGKIGSVYECTYNSKAVVLKIVKYVQSEGRFEREQQFYDFAKKYPERFLTLEASMIINNCKYDGFIPISYREKQRFKLLSESTQCAVLIYSPVLLNTLREVKYLMSDEQRKATYTYLKQSIDYMHAAGWRYNDLSKNNIMCKDWRDPTSFYIIDYGDVLNIHDPTLTPENKTQLQTSDDNVSLVSLFINKPEFNEMYEQKLVVPRHQVYHKCSKYYTSDDTERVILEMYIHRYKEYLAIAGCTPAMIAKAKQDPIARWLYGHLKK
jgi:serine/threonine protein kinase